MVFTSDNGSFGGVGDARPLRADKGHLYEGGIRVPLIGRWPAVVKAGTVSPEPVILTDFHPTLLEAAGLKPTDDSRIHGDAPRLTSFIGIKKTRHRPLPRAGHRHGTLSIKPTS